MKCSNTLKEKAKKSSFKFAFQIPDVGLALFLRSSFRKQEAENGVSEPRRQLPVTLSCLKMFADAFQCLWFILQHILGFVETIQVASGLVIVFGDSEIL